MLLLLSLLLSSLLLSSSSSLLLLLTLLLLLLLSLLLFACLLPRNNADTGGFSRDPLQAGQLSARLKHHLLHLQHGGPGRGTLPVGGAHII